MSFFTAEKKTPFLGAAQSNLWPFLFCQSFSRNFGSYHTINNTSQRWISLYSWIVLQVSTYNWVIYNIDNFGPYCISWRFSTRNHEIKCWKIWKSRIMLWIYFYLANEKKWSCDSSSKNELNLTCRQTAYLTPLKTPHDLNFVLFCKYENQGLCHDFIFT